MKWLYLALMPLCSAFKVTAQGYFSKDKLKTTADILKFNAFMSLFAAISLIIFTVRALPSFETVLYALAFGGLSVTFQLVYVNAFKTGPISLTSTICNFSIIISITFSIIAYNEPITPFKIIGFFLIILSFLLIPSTEKNGAKTSFKWFFLSILAAVLSGTTNVIQIHFSHSAFSGEKECLNALSYIFSTIICFSIIPFIKGKQPLYKTDKKLGLALPFIGLALGLYNLFYVCAMEIVPASEFVPSLSALTILVSISMSCITLKEKLSIKQLFGVLTTIGAVIIVNLQ